MGVEGGHPVPDVWERDGRGADYSTVWSAWWHRLPVLQVVVVNLTDGSAIRGVLWSVRGSWFTIRGEAGTKVQQMDRHGATLEADGEVLVHRERILFIQVPPSA